MKSSNFIELTVDGLKTSAGVLALNDMLKNLHEHAHIYPRWNDLKTPINAVKLAGVKDPGFDVFLGGTRAYAFANATAPNEEEIFFSIQLPHGYVLGSELGPHVHWSPSDTGAGDVRWGLEYSWVSVNGTFPATTTIYAEDTASGTANDHLIAAFADITSDGQGLSSMLMCRLFRNSSHANDTYAADAFLLEIDFHVQQDQIGSQSAFGGTGE